MATIKLTLRRKKRLNGECTIWLYVRAQGWPGPVKLSTDISTLPNKWDEVGQKITGRSKEVQRLNLILASKRSLASNILSDYELMRRDLSREKFKAEYLQPNLRKDFLIYFEKKMEEGYNRRLFGKSKYDGEKRTLRKITEFSKGELSFSELNRTWLEAFDAWHAKTFDKQKHKGETERARALKNIKKYVDQARLELEGVKIPNPFAGFKMPHPKSNPVFLEEKELMKLLDIYQDGEYIYDRMFAIASAQGMAPHHIDQYAHAGGVERIQRIMRKFLFQCLTGMRYSDMIVLEYSNVIGDHLTFTPQKTEDSSGKVVRMLLTNKLREIIGEKKQGRIFRHISNAKYNTYLKEVAEIAQIEKKISSHVGRHTFATISIQKGIPLPILKELMGLSSIKTLMKYVHTNQRMRDEYMEKAFGRME